MILLKGLIIKAPWIDLILSNQKIWEIRGFNTKIRGQILLIKSGTGKVFGTANIVDSFELTLEQFQKSYFQHKISIDAFAKLPYKHKYAWVLTNAKSYINPIPYDHPQGAVIWVNIDNDILKE